MFRTILVPASGSDTDVVVFATALTAARPYRAHLEFFHVCVSAGEALRYTPHASFARGEALHNVLQELKQESEHRSQAAQRHVRDFCKRNKIAMLDRPGRSPALSASWRMEAANGEDPFITRARLHDLVVMGRFTHPNGLPPDLLRLVLLGCGRPMMIAATSAPRAFHTLMVAWKDTREAARALTAAMPLLTEAKRVVVTAVEEPKASVNSAATVAISSRGTAFGPRHKPSKRTSAPLHSRWRSPPKRARPISWSWAVTVPAHCGRRFLAAAPDRSSMRHPFRCSCCTETAQAQPSIS